MRIPGDGLSIEVANLKTLKGSANTSFTAFVNPDSTIPTNFGPGKARLTRQICRKRSTSTNPRVHCSIKRLCIGRTFQEICRRPIPRSQVASAYHSSNFRLGSLPDCPVHDLESGNPPHEGLDEVQTVRSQITKRIRSLAHHRRQWPARERRIFRATEDINDDGLATNARLDNGSVREQPPDRTDPSD